MSREDEWYTISYSVRDHDRSTASLSSEPILQSHVSGIQCLRTERKNPDYAARHSVASFLPSLNDVLYYPEAYRTLIACLKYTT